MVGELPFQGDSVESVFEAVNKVKLDFCSGVWESVPQAACDLIAHTLTRDVSARFNADEVLSKPQYTSLAFIRLQFGNQITRHRKGSLLLLLPFWLSKMKEMTNFVGSCIPICFKSPFISFFSFFFH